MPPHPLPPPNLANAPPPRGLHPLALQNSLPPPPPPPPTHLQQLGSSAVSVLPSLDIAAAKQLTQIAGSEADQPGAPVTGGGVARAAHSAAAAQRPRHAADAAFASHATHSAAAAAAAEEVTDTSSQPRRRAREPSCRANQRWCDECVQAKRGELGSLSSAVSAEWVCVWWCAAYKWLVIHRMSARCVDAVRVVLYWLCRARLARW